MAYRIELTRAAHRELTALPPKTLKRVDACILALAGDPCPEGSKNLEGREGLRRVRVGDYRILYTVQDEVLLVLVVRIRHRREVYRGM